MGLTVYNAGYPAVERQSKCALSHEVLGLVQNHQQRILIYKLRRGFNHVHAHVHAHVHSSRSLLRPCANMQSSELPYAMRLAVVKSPSSLEMEGCRVSGMRSLLHTFSGSSFVSLSRQGLTCYSHLPLLLNLRYSQGTLALVFVHSLLTMYT